MQALNVQGIYNLVPHKYESQIGTASTRLRLETADPEPRHIIFRDAYLMVCVCVCCPKVDGLLKGPLALDGGHPAILSASSITQLAIYTVRPIGCKVPEFLHTLPCKTRNAVEGEGG